ncbi:MAG: PC4/YdbC family ssDNA-binding protein [Elusimicrobiota bacterium]
MAEAKEFKPLKEFGSIELAESSRVRFYVDEYKGHPYASIRTFVDSDSYSGPTKSGVTLNPNLLTLVIAELEKLPKEPQTTTDIELARFPKRTGLEIVLRITIYRDTTGIDMREWVDDGTYKGWSKRGIRIGYEELESIIRHLKEMLAFLRDRQKKKS